MEITEDEANIFCFGVFADPIKDVKDATIVEAFQKVFETLEERGLFNPKWYLEPHI